MYKISVSFLLLFLVLSAGYGQSLNNVNGNYPKKEKINGKTFRVAYYEHAINRSPEDVWAEVAGNFVDVEKVSASITESHCESGDLTEGMGAQRYCALEFANRTIQIKEEIIDYTVTDKRKEFTYDVYESKGFPAKVYNTWIVRVGDDGKTYLGTAFKMRAKFPFPTGMMMKKLIKQGGIRNGVLSYKHFLETGQGNLPGEELQALYPAQI